MNSRLNISLDVIREQCLPLIEIKLQDFFDDISRQGLAWNATMSRYHFATGGKRLRALIPCWVYAVHGNDPQSAIPLGCALELVHNATLVHDDLQDRDTVRRGQPTVWNKFSEAQAINCGDALFQFAIEMLLEMNITPEIFRRITRRLVRGTALVIEGQAQEFLMKDERLPKLDRYLGVVQGKTAALIATAVVSSMEALGIEADRCAQVEKAAMKSGVLFQIQDDILDIYGDKQRERRGTDIAEGKISVLIACLNERATIEEREQIFEVLHTPREKSGDEELQILLGLFDKYQILPVVLEEIGKLRDPKNSDAALADYPQMHDLLVEMNARFLKPIGHLL